MKPLLLAALILSGCATHTTRLVCYGSISKCWDANFDKCYQIVDFEKQDNQVYKIWYKEVCE